MLIARLVAQLDCYAPSAPMRPGRGCGIWGRAGNGLITEATACVQQLRDLLECAWPAVLDRRGATV